MAEQLTKLATRIDATSPRFEKNMRSMAELVSGIRNQEEEIKQGGGAKNIDSQHAKGRLTARERIDLLIDPKTDFFELGLYAPFGMYEEWGGAPSQGGIPGLGRIHGRLFCLTLNDPPAKARPFSPITAK